MPRPATQRSSTRLGPDVQAELGWLLDDAIEGISGAEKSILHGKKMSSVLVLGRSDAEQLSVSMRINLGELDRLWQQRIRERQALPCMQTFKLTHPSQRPYLQQACYSRPDCLKRPMPALLPRQTTLAIPHRSNAVSPDIPIWR